MRQLTALFVLAAIPASAKPTVITLEWSEFREMAEHIRFRKKVTVFTGAEGRDQIRMKLAGVSDSGITLAKKALRIAIDREDVHSVRMSPRWGNPLKWRLIAGALAFPLWFVGMNLGLMIPDGIPAGRWYNSDHAPQGFTVSLALPMAVYLLAQRADRRNGAIIFKLEE